VVCRASAGVASGAVDAVHAGALLVWSQTDSSRGAIPVENDCCCLQALTRLAKERSEKVCLLAPCERFSKRALLVSGRGLMIRFSCARPLAGVFARVRME